MIVSTILFCYKLLFLWQTLFFTRNKRFYRKTKECVKRNRTWNHRKIYTKRNQNRREKSDFYWSLMKKDKEKGKAIGVSSPVSSEDTDDKQFPSFPSVRFSSRNASSKYDFVKVLSKFQLFFCNYAFFKSGFCLILNIVFGFCLKIVSFTWFCVNFGFWVLFVFVGKGVVGW